MPMELFKEKVGIRMIKLFLTFSIPLCLSFIAAFSSAEEKACNDNYLVPATYVPHSLTSEDFYNLHFFVNVGNPEAGWRYLSNHGDGYAKMALQVVQTRFRPSTFLKHSLIRTHWIHTTGIKDFKEKFKGVAIQHLKQYIEILETGYWPDSDQILLSYIEALRKYNLSASTAFDINWQYSLLEPMLTWQKAVELTENRIVDPTRICVKHPSFKSNLTIIGDFLLMIPEGLGYGISTGFE